MITEGHLGRKGGRSPALIDVAQDHALALIADAGVFDIGVVFKAGTALRKSRAGSAGPYSTDLNFAGTDQPVAELLIEALDGKSLAGFTFRVEPLNEYRRSLLHLETPSDHRRSEPESTARRSAPGWLPTSSPPLPCQSTVDTTLRFHRFP